MTKPALTVSRETSVVIIPSLMKALTMMISRPAYCAKASFVATAEVAPQENWHTMRGLIVKGVMYIIPFYCMHQSSMAVSMMFCPLV